MRQVKLNFIKGPLEGQNLENKKVCFLGKGSKIKKRKSMVFDHRGGGGGSPKTKFLFRIEHFEP